MIWKRIFGRPANEEAAYRIYGSVVAQARSPALYLQAGVPDTLEGRFEMVVLHAFLVLRRLKAVRGAEVGPAKALGQKVFDILFDDMDQTLREIGVGDLSVGRKIKTMASAFYGRVAAYDEGLAASDASALEAALTRNVFAEMEPDVAQVKALATYVRQSAEALAAQDDEALMKGNVVMAPMAAPLAAEGPLA